MCDLLLQSLHVVAQLVQDLRLAFCTTLTATTPSSHSKNSLSKICSQGLGCPETFF